MVTVPRRKPSAARPELVWVQRERFMGWACSECAWKFNLSGMPAGNTLAEIKRNYERERDKEFESHVCAEHAKSSKSAPGDEPRKPPKKPRPSHDCKLGIVSAVAGPATKPNARRRTARKPLAAPTLHDN